MVDKKKDTETIVTETDVTTDVAETELTNVRLLNANKCVKKYMYWSMGFGLVPVPFIEVGALSAIQLKMLHDFSKQYEIPFSKNLGKTIVGTLIAGVSAEWLRRSVFTSLFKAIPVVGLVGTIPMSIYSGAITYAVGKVFIQHFESGGTFLTFNPEKVKAYFHKMFIEGKEVATRMVSREKKSTPAPAEAPATS